MMSYESKYYDCFAGILEKSTQQNSPYNETLKYLNEQFERMSMSEATRVQILSSVLPQMAVQFTSIAMNTALELAKAELSFNLELEGLKEQVRAAKLKNDEADEQRPDRLENLKKQGRLLEAQITKLNTENTLAAAQKSAIDEQVKDNRLIKATSVLADFISTNQAGGMIVPTDMTRYFFDLVYSISARSSVTSAKPNDFSMIQKKT